MSTLDPSDALFFELKYQARGDPWNFLGSSYERERYAAIIHALSHQQYRRAFEPGCSIGVLTERLAHIADEVIASDISPTAVESTRQRCKRCSNVHITCQSLAAASDFTGFDLIVLSEIGYYFTVDQWAKLVRRIIDGMASNATLLLSHWLGQSQDHKIHGDQVHSIVAHDPCLHHELGERYKCFRLDRWIKR